MRFSRPESEQARQRRVQSYEFLQKKHAEEPWVHLHYHGLRVSRGPWAARTLASVGSWERSPVPGGVSCGLVVSLPLSLRLSCSHLVVLQGERLGSGGSLSCVPAFLPVCPRGVSDHVTGGGGGPWALVECEHLVGLSEAGVWLHTFMHCGP